MSKFIKSALPFLLIGISLALFAAGYYRSHKDKKPAEGENPKDFSGMGPLFGVAIGIAIGTANDSIGAGLGAGIGMLIGTIIELVIFSNRNK